MDTAFTLPQIATSAVALVSLVIAFVALRRTTKLQQQQLRLLQLQEAGLHPSLTLYLVENYIRRLGPGSPRIYVFQIVVSNSSDLGNSIREARLIIAHEQGQGLPSNLVIAHKAELASRVPAAATGTFQLPAAIAARTSIGGLVLFEVPSEILRESPVESYALQVIDTYGHETSKEAILLQERTE
jgi:hypothetical protein